MILPGTGRGTAEGGGGGQPRILRPEMVTARGLRRTMTFPEVLLWQALRGRRTGIRFRRQHPIGPYVVDFCCVSTRLVIEVDGEAHGCSGGPARDEARDAFATENGFRMFRIMAADVLRDLDAVIRAVVAQAESPLHQPADGPPPRAGEDLRPQLFAIGVFIAIIGSVTASLSAISVNHLLRG